ncbi:hypothetical protein [Streptomyces fulvoviolaceus]|uniref:hypothetical protein n=1 Tax=Streptomyces fulvoviolaceus TaxID=285535 RepID=UPI0021BE21A6|nr:hypothetical protein [Streptomyces fulvoviolaceus]MCT9081318.1 hypothetical protein [Streptomyces fulvoviolaceus]
MPKSRGRRKSSSKKPVRRSPAPPRLSDLMMRDARLMTAGGTDVLQAEAWLAAPLGEREPEERLCLEVTGRASTTPLRALAWSRCRDHLPDWPDHQELPEPERDRLLAEFTAGRVGAPARTEPRSARWPTSSSTTARTTSPRVLCAGIPPTSSCS